MSAASKGTSTTLAVSGYGGSKLDRNEVLLKVWMSATSTIASHTPAVSKYGCVQYESEDMQLGASMPVASGRAFQHACNGELCQLNVEKRQMHLGA